MSQRQVFFSFHYARDFHRAAQVRALCSGSLVANEWESRRPCHGSAVAQWIGAQLRTADCTVVLIGSETSDRGWINYEIAKSWNDGKGILGIDIHGLPDELGQQCSIGKNPFDNFVVDGCQLSSIVQVYDPWRTDSADACHVIDRNIAEWVEDAILTRDRYDQSYVRAT